MNYFDSLIVGGMTRLLRGAMAVGTALVYLQAALLALLVVGAAALTVALLVAH